MLNRNEDQAGIDECECRTCTDSRDPCGMDCLIGDECEGCQMAREQEEERSFDLKCAMGCI